MDILEILKDSVQKEASDIFLIAGAPRSYKIGGVITPQTEEILVPQQTEEMMTKLFDISGRDKKRFYKYNDDDFSFAINGVGRFRVNAYRQRNSIAAVIRVVHFDLPKPKALHIPESVMSLAQMSKGLVLVTGAAGSGKSTTLACMIDDINMNRNGHIITLEDPIEFVHRHKNSIVSQREVGIDTESYVSGLKGILREAPDVILLGEMRDYEAIQIAMTAAETGQLIFSTLHTLGAANTIDRIIDVFPPKQQQQIRIQLAMVLQAVVSQQLIPGKDGKLVPIFEVMVVNHAIRNMIREGKTHQIDALMASTPGEMMQLMDEGLLVAYQKGQLTAAMAVSHATQPEILQKKIDKYK